MTEEHTRRGAEIRELLGEERSLGAALKRPAIPDVKLNPPSPPIFGTAQAIIEPRARPVTPRPEWRAERIRDVLLWTGAGLVALSALSLVAVLWSSDIRGFFTAGRVAVLLLAVAALSAMVTVRLRDRLPATAEAMGSLTLVLVGTDWYAIRRSGLGGGVDPALWWSLGTAVVAGVAIAFSFAGLRAPRVTAPILGQCSALLLVSAADDVSVAAIGFACFAGASVVVASRLDRHDHLRLSASILIGGVALFELVAFVSTIAAVAQVGEFSQVAMPAVAVAVLGLAPALSRWLLLERISGQRHLGDVLVGASALAVMAAIVIVCSSASNGEGLIAIIAVVGAAAVGLACVIVTPLRTGVANAGLLLFVSTAAVATVGALIVLFKPLELWNEPWGLELSASSSQSLLRPGSSALHDLGWTAAVFGIGAVVGAIIGSQRDRRLVRVSDGALAVVAPATLIWSVIGMAALVPIAADAPVWVAAATCVGVFVTFVAIAISVEVRHRQLMAGLLIAAVLPYVSGLGWALTHRALTVAVFAVTAVTTGLAARQIRSTPQRVGLYGAALTATLATVTSVLLAVGTSEAATGFALVVSALVALMIVAVRARPSDERAMLEIVAMAGVFVGLGLAGASLWWLAGALTAAAIGLAVTASRPSHLPYFWGALASGIAAVQCGFAAAGVGAPEQGLVLTSSVSIVFVVAVAGRRFNAGLVNVERVACVGLVVGAFVAAESLTWLAGAVTVATVTLTFAAVRPGGWHGYKHACIAGAATSFCLWMAVADVRTMEAYTIPAAIAALAIGFLARRQHPNISSWLAYGPGLLVGIGPSLVLAISEDNLARLLLVILGGLVCTVVGAATRLQAPLLIGSAALITIGLDAMAPAVAAVPRWIPLGIAGVTLLWIGATAERRLAQVQQLRSALGRLG